MNRIDGGSEPAEGDARSADVASADAPEADAEAGDSPGSVVSPRAEASPVPASDAFAALGNDVRTAVLESLSEGAPRRFSDLFEAAPVETSAGFAYHLRQLEGLFVRKDEDGYRLTSAGRRAARDVRTGTFTERVDFGPIDLEEDCPVCDEDGLRASCVDNHVTIACECCDRSILALPLPDGGADGTPEALVESLDRHTRKRLSLVSGGFCPECAGPVEARIDRPTDGLVDGLEGERAQVQVTCPNCGCRLGYPVALAVIDHPAVVSFYHEHDRDAREGPVWNVGEEWRETVLSTDPWCVRVTTRLDDEVLSLLVGGDLTVVETDRFRV